MTVYKEMACLAIDRLIALLAVQWEHNYHHHNRHRHRRRLDKSNSNRSLTLTLTNAVDS